MSNEFLDNEYEEAIEELLETLGNIPKQSITMLSMPRYVEAVKSISKIIKFVKEDCPDAQIKVDFDELTGSSLLLTIIADEFNIYKIKDFCAAIAPANTMSIIPRLDEKLEIGFSYEGVKVPAPPQQ